VTLAVAVAGYGWWRGAIPRRHTESRPDPRLQQARQRIAELERERDRLRRALALAHTAAAPTPPSSDKPAKASRGGERQRRTPPAASLEPEPKPNPTQPPAPTPAAPQARQKPPAETGKLRLEPLQIATAGGERRYHYHFAVSHADDTNARVNGTIWIAVNGLSDNRPTRLSLRRISPDKTQFVTMSFERRQEVEGDIRLPEHFTPKNVIVEVKPADDHYTAVAETFDWAPQGPGGG
jgi:hypothetical protein